MIDQKIQDIIRAHNIFSHQNSGVTVLKVTDKEAGSVLAQEIITAVTDRHTMLFLSGGTTPDRLYELLSGDDAFLPGAVGLIDERYGARLHDNSNEFMIQQTGLLRYLTLRDIPFYPILSDLDLMETADASAEAYDEKIRSLGAVFHKSIGILGVGKDGHTAGIAGNRRNFTNQIFSDKSALVSCFDDSTGPFKKRITMTFTGLEMLDFIVVLAFGPDKLQALEETFSPGSREVIPARFYTNPGVAAKTLFITDQKV